jgi:hypothetical protein
MDPVMEIIIADTSVVVYPKCVPLRKHWSLLRICIACIQNEPRYETLTVNISSRYIQNGRRYENTRCLKYIWGFIHHTVSRQPDGRKFLCVQRNLLYDAHGDHLSYVAQFYTNTLLSINNVQADDDTPSKMYYIECISIAPYLTLFAQTFIALHPKRIAQTSIRLYPKWTHYGNTDRSYLYRVISKTDPLWKDWSLRLLSRYIKNGFVMKTLIAQTSVALYSKRIRYENTDRSDFCSVISKSRNNRPDCT